MGYEFDVVVIGSGSAGLTAAKQAVDWGAKVALVEKLPRFGGDCTWFGCVPSKALIRCATAHAEVRQAARFGVDGIDPNAIKCNWDNVKNHIQTCQKFIYFQDDSPETLSNIGINVWPNRLASFTDPHTLKLEKPAGTTDAEGLPPIPETVTADSFIICTGAGPSLPSIAGLEEVPYLTYETIFELPTFPDSLVVVGGGPIGAELAQAFARLGSTVTIVGKLMPREDDDVREVMQDVFDEDGIVVKTGRATKVSKGGQGIVVEVSEKGSPGEKVTAAQLLVCSGRAPKGLEALKLEKGGVKFSPKGIEVDAKFRTTTKHIFACGDCLGGQQFTHLAGYQGGKAVFNALMPISLSAPKPEDCPRTTFTHPEVATVGFTESEAKAKFGAANVVVLHRGLNEIDRAICEGETKGFAKILTDKTGIILGGTVVATTAGEMASELGVAAYKKLNIGDIANCMHSYPSWVFGLQQMAAPPYTNRMRQNGMFKCLLRCCGRRLRGAAPPLKKQQERVNTTELKELGMPLTSHEFA